MRILQVLPELNVGGVETGTIDFAKYLVDHGHHSVVISNGGRMVSQLENQGSVHYSIPVHQKNLITMIGCINRVRDVIRKEKVDIVHARSRIPALIAYLACHQTNAEFITTCHGYYSKHFFSSVMGWAKRVIVVSEVVGRHMIETFNVPPERIRLIPRSVDLDRFKNQHHREVGQSSFVISNVGRLSPIKGHTYFLQAMAKVVRTMPFVKIWIIGDASPKKMSYRQELETLVKRLGLTNYVEFLGNRSNVPELLTETDVLVLSTIVPETFGRAVLEAQAAGVPVVATNVGGVVDIVQHEKTGLLVEPRDPDAMAQAVIRLINDHKLCENLVSESQKRIKKKYLLKHMCEATLDVYHDLKSSQNILVIKIGAIGDIILATASLKEIRRKFPKAKIACLVGKEAAPLLQRCPYIDEIIIFDSKFKDCGVLGLIKLSLKIRRQKFDKVIDFQNNEKSHLLAWLSGARELYGYRNKKLGFLLNRGINNVEKNISPVEHQFKVLNELDIQYTDSVQLELWPSDQDFNYIDELLESEWLTGKHKIVGVNVAASERWRTKNWPEEKIALLCDRLAELNVRVILTGTDKDKNLVKRIKGKAKSKVADFSGKTNILQLAALIKRCNVFITPDSAPLHVAAAMEVPFIAFFGPTDERRHLPPSRTGQVLSTNLDCRPCYSTTCLIKTHACMKDITVEKVVSKVMELMD